MEVLVDVLQYRCGVNLFGGETHVRVDLDHFVEQRQQRITYTFQLCDDSESNVLLNVNFSIGESVDSILGFNEGLAVFLIREER